MCGRFAMTESEEKVMNDFQIEHSEVFLEPRYNISPSQDIPVIVQQEGPEKDRYCNVLPAILPNAVSGSHSLLFLHFLSLQNGRT